MKSKLVSVIIPAYNRAKVLSFSLESVLKQTYKNLEIIVVDDNSNDNTQEIVNTYIAKDKRIKYLRHEQNKGGGAARNTGISHAKGFYIAFLDSDDAWYPEKIKLQIELMEKNQNIEILFTGSIETKYPSNKLIRKRIIKNSIPLKKLYMENYLGTTSSVMCKASLLKSINGFDPALKSAQDWDLYLKAVKQGNYYIIEKPLLNHTEPEDGDKYRISSNKPSVLSGLLIMVEKIMIMMGNDKNLNNLDKRNILCRLNYKIAKIYFYLGNRKLAYQYLKFAIIQKPFDLRCLKLGFSMLLVHR
ncbi:glycosyltransferase family 2 protein [Bacillus sp. SJS]|uniref:glycosyltransferase family 2 protein n=1 Tax=Bacillus sp. SJS TaxID=1423321 RepID=UPI0006908857|nr:glycosyltransferase family 2 protein [Bacillus sp. SJS]KZZ83903.1 hypothetical protein AS29_014230 [Bacillus sp. SJS]